ncbi:hypothetical protein [Zunongwangia sp.]|uniref:hypothetical protein n=1 Tax=Zunongwangia sp. TaxID=1965325 RepID=UPI003AA90CCD
MRTLIALLIFTISFSANAQKNTDTIAEEKLDSIQLVLKKNQKIQQIYSISQIDYILDSDSYSLEQSKKFKVHFSASLVSQIDKPFLNWLKGNPEEWSGNLMVYEKGKKEPTFTLDFERSKITSFSQTIDKEYPLNTTIYFASILEDVLINGIELE